MVDFTQEFSMSDIERQFSEYDELEGLDEFGLDSEVIQSTEMIEQIHLSREGLDDDLFDD